jgi:hypothetical protein
VSRGLNTKPKEHKGQRSRTCEENGVRTTPPKLEPVPAHDHSPITPDEARDAPVATRTPLTLPKGDHLTLVLFRVSGGVGDPALDSIISERECPIVETALVEMFIEIDAHDPSTFFPLLEVEVEGEGKLGTNPAGFSASKLLALSLPFLTLIPHHVHEHLVEPGFFS